MVNTCDLWTCILNSHNSIPASTKGGGDSHLWTKDTRAYTHLYTFDDGWLFTSTCDPQHVCLHFQLKQDVQRTLDNNQDTLTMSYRSHGLYTISLLKGNLWSGHAKTLWYFDMFRHGADYFRNKKHLLVRRECRNTGLNSEHISKHVVKTFFTGLAARLY